MSKKKVVSKGYTVEVVSWENDGDLYQTHRVTFKTKEEALAVKHLAEALWQDHYEENSKSISSMMDEDFEDMIERVYKYFLENDKLLEYCDLNTQDSADNIYDGTMHYKNKLMGSSENYLCRVCESVTILYSPEDIYLEEISE